MLNITIEKLAEVIGGRIISGDIDKYGKCLITRVSFDSRDTDEASLFVPIIGERVDAHKFVGSVLKGECAATLWETGSTDLKLNDIMSEIKSDPNAADIDKIIIETGDNIAAVQKLAAYCRSLITMPVIAVTGSVGKTTTREMIALALSAGKKVYSTKGNSNSQIGVPKTIFEWDDDAEIAVLELGMSMPGEMERLAGMALPDTVAFTNIGVTHIENLGSRENILKEKMHITDYMKNGDMVMLNYDNDMLKDYQLREGLVPMTYGHDPSCNAYVKDINESSVLPDFSAEVNGKEVKVKLSAYGDHMIMNALVALLMADIYGVNLNAAAERLSEYTGYKHRCQITTPHGVTLIDDTYNASPDSMRAAVDILSKIPCDGRRIAVLADMKELGDMGEKIHLEMGEFAAEKNIDTVITYGELGSKISEGFYGRKVNNYENHEAIEKFLQVYAKPGDAVLFKGSNSMKLFDLVDRIAEYEFK